MGCTPIEAKPLVLFQIWRSQIPDFKYHAQVRGLALNEEQKEANKMMGSIHVVNPDRCLPFIVEFIAPGS